MNFTLHEGGCLAVMRDMLDGSVDSIVTDPPYGLSFMGKKWDYDVPSVEVWAECLRVLKPGGHLLAFAGTRTQHRMAVRIEDAGFEIRDMICWTYASGFPKSHNLDNLRGEKVCGCAVPYTHEGAEQTTEHDLRSVRVSDVPKAEPAGEERRQVLQPGVQEQGAPAAGWSELPDAEDGGGQPGLEGRRDASQAPGQLRSGALHPCADVGFADGQSGWLRDGASSGDGGMVRLPVDTDGVRAPRGPQPAEQRSAEPRTVAGQPKPQALGAWPVCRGCGLPVLPRGLGTALKPALEPITVARKPLVGTVAANVLEWGTGALNIDGCMVETTDNLNGGAYSGGAKDMSKATSYATGVNAGEFVQPTGRWPANLIHDGSEEVVSLFPREASAAAPVTVRNGDKFRSTYGAFAGNIDEGGSTFHADTGSAARFFYCAKASKRDRDEGLEGFAVREAGSRHAFSGLPDQRMDREQERHGARNHHPTVKPTDLMRYLCRLVTPKGGIVLDPFMGSGSTGKAAVLENFNFIGIELNPEYVEIARARIAFAQRQGHQPSLLEAA